MHGEIGKGKLWSSIFSDSPPKCLLFLTQINSRTKFHHALYLLHIWYIDSFQTISLKEFLGHFFVIYYCFKCPKFKIDVLLSFVYFAFLYFSPWGQKLPPYLFCILELHRFFFIFWNLLIFSNVLHVLSIFRNKSVF